MSKCLKRVLLGLAMSALLSSAASVTADEQAADVKNPFEGRDDLVPEGKSLFNQYCSHCHGPDAVQGERPRDLRRLKIRYGDGAIKTYWTTVNNGRMDKGMPVWKEALSDDIKWRIFTFLQTIQAQP